ncbi:winged helix-turn-helix transcriptional regulator [Liquorilactobacillus ghanensis]|nr:helix-turn-helix domain-containing protein [Liquorilactobacillus ghanensis]
MKTYTVDNCPIQPVVDIISGKWTSLVLWEISQKHNHYGELKRQLGGISTRTLAARLKMLEKQGIVSRNVFPTTPPTVEYVLTKKGLDLAPILYAMRDWSEKYDNTNL